MKEIHHGSHNFDVFGIFNVLSNQFGRPMCQPLSHWCCLLESVKEEIKIISAQK